MIPRVGEPVASNRRYKARPGIYAVLIREGSVLLTHQDAPIPEFQLPGGGIDPGEHPILALHREVIEETGWKIDRPRRLGAFRRFTFMPEYDLWAEKICHIYFARPALEMSAPSEVGHTAVWAPLQEAIEIVANDGDRLFLSKFQGRP